jgi:hypothetical protein
MTQPRAWNIGLLVRFFGVVWYSIVPNATGSKLLPDRPRSDSLGAYSLKEFHEPL